MPTMPRIDNMQILRSNRSHSGQFEESGSLYNSSTNSNNSESSSQASKLAKLGAGALAWTAVKVVRTTAVAIFGLGVGVGLILGDSFRSEEHGRELSYNVGGTSETSGNPTGGRPMPLPYPENSLPPQ